MSSGRAERETIYYSLANCRHRGFYKEHTTALGPRFAGTLLLSMSNPNILVQKSLCNKGYCGSKSNNHALHPNWLGSGYTVSSGAWWPAMVVMPLRVFEGHVTMSEENNIQEKVPKPFPKRTVLLVIVIGIAVTCFTLVAVLPSPERPLLKDPLRSLLTGLGLLGVACPLFLVGSILGKRSATSPYFEEAFIATVFNVFGFVCFFLGLICTGLSIYALVKWVLGSG
jgi:hypothetical protein